MDYDSAIKRRASRCFSCFRVDEPACTCTPIRSSTVSPSSAVVGHPTRRARNTGGAWPRPSKVPGKPEKQSVKQRNTAQSSDVAQDPKEKSFTIEPAPVHSFVRPTTRPAAPRVTQVSPGSHGGASCRAPGSRKYSLNGATTVPTFPRLNTPSLWCGWSLGVSERGSERARW